MLLLQETKLHHHEESYIGNKLGKGRPFWLNSPDLYADSFTDRLEMTKRDPIHGTGIILDKDTAGAMPEVYENTGHRFQHVRLAGINYINCYMPTADTRAEGKEKLERALSDLDRILTPLAGEPVALIGDMNLSDKHTPGRKNLFREFFEKHKMKLYTPEAATNFPYKGEPAALDHMAASHHFTGVRVEVLGRTRVPLNTSTHVPLIWTFNVHEFRGSDTDTKEEGKIKSEKLPRPDWRFKIDYELWDKIEPVYVDVAMDITRGMETTWRVKTVEFMLSRASARARIVPREVEADTNLSRKWFAKKIKDLSQRVWEKRNHLAGEFARFVTTEELIEMYPDKGREISDMEAELGKLRQRLNLELHRVLQIEADRDSDQLMVTMRSGDSSKFHQTSKVTKVMINDTPKLIRHEGVTYTGNDVLKVFAKSAAEQSGEHINIPGNIPSDDYVLKKETVMMAQFVAKYDDSYFVEITEEKYNKLLSLLPSGKSPDIYGVSSEHLKFASSETNRHVRFLLNLILSDITQFSDFWISISLAIYIHKGKNRDPTIMKSYRRIQIGCLIQKMIQRLVEDQLTESVREHEVKTQWGFSKGVSFLQCSVTRECLTKLSIEREVPLYCVAADVQSAFSRTNRVVQLFECQRQGERGKLFLFSIGFFSNTDVILSANGLFSERFSEWLGAAQGGIRSPGAWRVFSVPLSEMISNSGIGARFYDIDFGLALVADDSLGFTTSENRFKLMSKIYERYARDHDIIYEYSKLELNLWGVKNAVQKADGLEFGGYKHKVSMESTHVGLQILQDQSKSVTQNVNRRLSKTNARVWGLMSKCWAQHRHVNLAVHRELIKSVVKPSLTSGLQALTIVDTGLKPLEKFQDKMVRRTVSHRRRSSVLPLEMILQIPPLKCDYHQSVMSLLYNIWINPGPCQDLMLHLLRDKSLKTLHWPHNVTRILNRYELPGAEYILTSKPVTKTAFKTFMKEKIVSYHVNVSEGRLMRSNLYRFIYANDFSFARKILHPMLRAAHTRRQTLSMKLAIHHICMEYPNGENLCRIGMRKSKLCHICEDEGVTAIDNTEHNLFSCVCVSREAAATKLRSEIFDIIIKIKGDNRQSVRLIAESDPVKAAILFLNPCSNGLGEKLRIDYRDKDILFLFKSLQRYTLLCHNLRLKYGGYSCEKPVGRRPTLCLKSKGRSAQTGRNKRSIAESRSNLRKITDFFSSQGNGNSDNCDNCEVTFFIQLGLTRTEARGLENMSKNWNVLGTAVGGKLMLFSTMMTSQLGNCEVFRHAVIRHHANKGIQKLVVFHTDDTCLSKTLATVTVDCFDATMVETLSQFGRFHLKVKDYEPEFPNQRCPITFICTTEPTPIKIEGMEEFDEYCGMVLSDGRYKRKPRMQRQDEDRLEAHGKDFGTSILCEDLESWAREWFSPTEFEVNYNTERDHWPDSAWQRPLLYLEYSRPGTAIYCSGKAGANWPMATVSQVTKKTPSCKFVYRGNINSHFRSMFNTDIPQEESSEWFMMNEGSDFTKDEVDSIQKMSIQLAQVMKEKKSLEIEVSNLQLTTQFLASHNAELLKHVSDYACGNDVMRKDGQNRRVKFRPIEEADREMPGLIVDDDEEDFRETEALVHKTITQNVVKPVDFRYRSGTTVNMEPDLRLVIDARKQGKKQTVASPDEDAAMGNGPDLDEIPEVNQGSMGAPPVVSLQGLEGWVVRKHGAVPGILTSSSSSEGETSLPESAKYIQVPTISRKMNVARGRATIIRKPGKVESIRKISCGRAKPAETAAAVGQGSAVSLPVKPDFKESDEAVFMDAEDSTSTTFIKPVPTPFVDVNRSSATVPKPPSQFVGAPQGSAMTPRDIKVNLAKKVSENKTEKDPYDLKHEVKGEPEKAVTASIDADDEMEVSVVREGEEAGLEDISDGLLDVTDTPQDEADAVSENNLSDVQLVEEFPEVELQRTESILERMGNEKGVLELCEHIDGLLNPQETSTPQRSPARSSSLSSHPSMPPLEELSSASPSDSGNASDNTSSSSAAAAAADRVKVILNENLLMQINMMTNISCSRNHPTSQSEFSALAMLRLTAFGTILQQCFITYLFNLFRNPNPNYVEYFRSYYTHRVLSYACTWK